jgi:hypothetical protein
MLAAAALVAVACSGPQQRVDGVVVAVDGGLGGVAGFEVVTTSGERLAFVPDPDLHSFDDGAPLSHLTDHLRTGVPVRVVYEDRSGVLVAVALSDAP